MNNGYAGLSLLKVSKSDWDSRKNFTCSVTHNGTPKAVKVQKPPPPPPPKVALVSAPNNGKQALFCTVEDRLSGTPEQFKWSLSNGSELRDSIQFPVQTVDNLHSAVSILKINNEEWENGNVYICEVTYRGIKSTKKISKDAITMTLNQPSAKEIHNNNQAQLDCVITGKDQAIVTETAITWKTDEQSVTGTDTGPKSEGSQHSKTSTITLTYDEWQKVNKVRCSATHEYITPVIQDLIVRKGSTRPNVRVYAPKKIEHSDTTVTLVCLVSSDVLQDYYIAWTESGGNYADGTTFPAEKTQTGYLVTSVYTTTVEKWMNNTMFGCEVLFVGNNRTTITDQVSKAADFSLESELTFALSCTEDATEEDEFSSLWSTTSSFIFLFISCLFYNMIFSLVKMKRQ